MTIHVHFLKRRSLVLRRLALQLYPSPCHALPICDVSECSNQEVALAFCQGLCLLGQFDGLKKASRAVSRVLHSRWLFWVPKLTAATMSVMHNVITCVLS